MMLHPKLTDVYGLGVHTVPPKGRVALPLEGEIACHGHGEAILVLGSFLPVQIEVTHGEEVDIQPITSFSAHSWPGSPHQTWRRLQDCIIAMLNPHDQPITIVGFWIVPR